MIDKVAPREHRPVAADAEGGERLFPVFSLVLADEVIDHPVAPEALAAPLDRRQRLLRGLGGVFGGRRIEADVALPAPGRKNGRAHVCTPATNAHHVCRSLLAQ